MRNLTDEERSSAILLGVHKAMANSTTRSFKLSFTYSYEFTVEIVHLIGEALHNSVDR